MVAELQAWVGHLLVAGGRAVRMPPPGALAETAPKRAPRVREEDTFFILVTPAKELHAPAPFFQDMAALGADTYFGSSGGITGGLREALTTIHQHAADQPVNALAVVLRGADVYAARGGRGVCGAVPGRGDRSFSRLSGAIRWWRICRHWEPVPRRTSSSPITRLRPAR